MARAMMESFTTLAFSSSASDYTAHDALASFTLPQAAVHAASGFAAISLAISTLTGVRVASAAMFGGCWVFAVVFVGRLCWLCGRL